MSVKVRVSSACSASPKMRPADERMNEIAQRLDAQLQI
jgi:hypothetical protein